MSYLTDKVREHECDDYHDGYCSQCCMADECPACVERNTEHGYRIEITETKVTWRYVFKTEAEADEVAWDAERYNAFNRGESITATVTRCPHDNGYGEHHSLNGGNVTLIKWVCEDCGEHYQTDIEHETYYRMSDMWRRFRGREQPDNYCLMTVGYLDEKLLAHI